MSTPDNKANSPPPPPPPPPAIDPKKDVALRHAKADDQNKPKPTT